MKIYISLLSHLKYFLDNSLIFDQNDDLESYLE